MVCQMFVMSFYLLKLHTDILHQISLLSGTFKQHFMLIWKKVFNGERHTRVEMPHCNSSSIVSIDVSV